MNAKHKQSPATELGHTGNTLGEVPRRKCSLINGQLFDLAEFQVSSTLKLPSGISGIQKDAIVKASVARYRKLDAADAIDHLLNELLEGLTNAAMASMQYAAETDAVQVRTEELKSGTRAVRAATDLVETCDKRRRPGKQRAVTPDLNVQVSQRDPMEHLYEEVDAIRRRAGGTNPLPIKERSPVEVLASLSEEEYRAFFAPIIRKRAEAKAG